VAVLQEPLYLDPEVAPGEVWEYRVFALDRADPPNASEPSETVTGEVAVEEP
jgi:hypothetical protein